MYQFGCAGRGANHDGQHAEAEGATSVEMLGTRFAEKQCTVLMQARHSFWLAPDDAEGGERGGCHGRRQTNREDEAGCGVLQDLDEFGIASDIASDRRECLAERTHPDIYLSWVYAAMFGQASPGRPEHTGAVSIVHHQPRTIFLLDLDDAGQVRHVAFGRIEAFDHDEAIPVLGSFISK